MTAHALAASPVEEAFSQEYQARFSAVAAEFAKHIRQRGWMNSTYYVYFNNKYYFYNIYFNNTGADRANMVWINDTLPSWVTYVSDTSSTAAVAAGRPSFETDWTDPGTEPSSSVRSEMLSASAVSRSSSPAKNFSSTTRTRRSRRLACSSGWSTATCRRTTCWSAWTP